MEEEEEEEEEGDIGEKSTGADLSSELNPLLTTTNVQFVRFINSYTCRDITGSADCTRNLL